MDIDMDIASNGRRSRGNRNSIDGAKAAIPKVDKPKPSVEGVGYTS